MARPHRVVRTDENQAEIVADLQRLGAIVWRLSDLGGEVLDLLVCWRGKCLPVEVKTSDTEADLTEGERDSIRALSLVGVEAIVATCAEDVIGAFEVGPPHWQVVDQEASKRFNELMETALAMAVKLTKTRYKSEYLKQRICALRDVLMDAYDAACEAIEFR